MTARSVKIRFTQRLPVSGSVQCSTIFALPSLAVCSIITKTFSTPCTRSIAPPIPLIILPGIVQLARSPAAETCIAPSTATSRWPPRMIPNEDDEEKNAAPGNVVTVSLPALIRSASRSSRRGYGPTPRIPFSECKTTVMSAGMWLGIRVGNPTPRLTYCPSCSSVATRAASSSRLQLMAVPPGKRVVPPPHRFALHRRWRSWPHRLLFDLLHRVGHMHHPVHVDPLGVHLGGVDLARFDQVLNLRDSDLARYGTVRVEVGGRRVVDQVAVPVAFEGVHQCEVSADGSFEHASDPVEFAGFLRRRGDGHRTVWVVPPRQTAVGDLRPNPRGCVEGGDPGPAGAQPLGQRALRGQLQLKLTGHVLPGKFFVLPDVGVDSAPDPLVLQQYSQADPIHAQVVRDRLEIVDTELEQRRDQRLGDAAQPEPADGQRRPVRHVGNSLRRRCHDLVPRHQSPRRGTSVSSINRSGKMPRHRPRSVAAASQNRAVSVTERARSSSISARPWVRASRVALARSM